MTAAGVIEPVIAHDKVSVKLSLPQRSLHSGMTFPSLVKRMRNEGSVAAVPVARTGQIPIFGASASCARRPATLG
jgi:hypothetical protein